MNAHELLSELNRVSQLLTEARLEEFAAAASGLEQSLMSQPPVLTEPEAAALQKSGHRLGRLMQEAARLTGALLDLQHGPEGEAYNVDGARANSNQRRTYGEV